MFLVNLVKNAIDFLSAPQYLVSGALIGLVAAIHWRPIWTPRGGAVLLALLAGGIGLSYLDPNFNKVATLPDNVPIVGMIFLVGFFFWFAMSQAYANDRRIAEGRPPFEGEDSAQKVFSWPDLVYVELICLVIVMAVMIVWSIYLKAPLEEPANPTDSPNPAKAPWYFLGLQEMVSYSAFWGGIGIPGLLVALGVAAPFLERKPGGEGVWLHGSRSAANWIFLILMSTLGVLTLIGTLFRGENWALVVPW